MIPSLIRPIATSMMKQFSSRFSSFAVDGINPHQVSSLVKQLTHITSSIPTPIRLQAGRQFKPFSMPIATYHTHIPMKSYTSYLPRHLQTSMAAYQSIFRRTLTSRSPIRIPPSFHKVKGPIPKGFSIRPSATAGSTAGAGGNIRITLPPGMGRGMGGFIGQYGGGGILRRIVLNVIVLLIVFTIFNALQGGGGGLGNDILGRKHKQAVQGDISDRLSDVIGVDDVLEQVTQIVEFLKEPDKYLEMGATIPRGVLLTGPPGTGKTLIARAIAGEAGVNFLWCSAADFDEIYVGTGSRRVRDLFQDARSKAPCIIFIDEIDAFGKRNSGPGGGNSSRNTINSLLVEMDGFSPSDNILVMAATNFPDLLDEALLRPGRFDYQLALRPPDFEGRVKLFQHYVGKVKHDGKIDPQRLASIILGATGADIKTIVNNAAVLAASRSAPHVTQDDIEEAQEQFIMGVKNSSKSIDKRSFTRTAYHEAGHALLSVLLPGNDDIYKATILPRGGALGYVAPKGSDSPDVNRTQLESQLIMAMGGRAAEELIYGEELVTTGCSSDLEQASKKARAMIKKLGFGGGAGKVIINDEASSDLKDRAEKDVEILVNNAYHAARQILAEHHVEHERLARALLRYETLNHDEILEVIKGNSLPHRLGKHDEDCEPVFETLVPFKYSLFKRDGHNDITQLKFPDRSYMLDIVSNSIGSALSLTDNARREEM